MTDEHDSDASYTTIRDYTQARRLARQSGLHPDQVPGRSTKAGSVIRGSTTHEVSIDRARGIVVKRFRSADRDEPAREWAALKLLARHAPGLAPAPVRADLDAAPATIEMTWLAGTELGGPTLTPAQTQALAAALDRLRSCVPSPRGHPATTRACATAAAWLDSGALNRPYPGSTSVLGQGDPCLANFIWDGTQIRCGQRGVPGVADGQRLEPDQGAFQNRHLQPRVHASLLIAPGIGTLPWTGCRTVTGPGPSDPPDERR